MTIWETEWKCYMEIKVLSLKLESTKVQCCNTALGMRLIYLPYPILTISSCVPYCRVSSQYKVYQDPLFISLFVQLLLLVSITVSLSQKMQQNISVDTTKSFRMREKF